MAARDPGSLFPRRSCQINAAAGNAYIVRMGRCRRRKKWRQPKDEILHDHNHDGIDRRGFLKCMAWAGTGAFCVMRGGVLKSYSLSRLRR